MRDIFYLFILTITFGFGAAVANKVAEPLQMIWGVVFGIEIHSAASFPLGHTASIYSSPGVGDQQLICVVDGVRVFRTADWEPGNVKEEIMWDESGKVVTFIASGHKFFTYDTETGVGESEQK
jgi:hypothetical protein